ncbi:hypothetical protein BHE74_00030760 [Ensete ventricosum]|nr:hypothetical protein BHE74_00030760 [Ensete ventricosum]
MAEAGRKQGRTNFAVTCTLLSQYIKEKGSIADLGLGIAQDAAKGKSESVRLPTTVSVIPGADLCRGEDGAMELFSRSDDLGPAVLIFLVMNPSLLLSNPEFDPFSSKIASSQIYNALILSLCGTADLPIARKASLQRFLEKRKDR